MTKRKFDPKTIELLQGAGIELARGYLKNAVETAPNAEIMQNQILTLQFCALHILATCVMNKVLQNKYPLEQAADEMLDALTYEINAIMSDPEEPELVEITEGPLQ